MNVQIWMDRKFRFTHKAIDDLPPRATDSASAMDEYSDSDVVGLKLTVGSTGRKYFSHRYTFRGRKRVLKLGEYPSLSVAEARQMVHEHKNMLGKGKDPADERNRQKQMPTLAEFAKDDYLPHARLRKRSVRDDEAKLRGEIGKRLGKVPLDQIARRDVMNLHEAMRKKTSPATANRYLSALSALLTLAVKKEYLERNPAHGVDKFKEPPPRKRTLEGEELSKFLQALNTEKNRTAANALNLLLLTGVRSRSELFSRQWSELDLDRGTMNLAVTKNGNERTVVLNSFALALLKALRQEAAPDCPWVFPATRGKLGHLSDVRKPLGRALRIAGIKNVRPHDLRRSFGSLAVNAGVDIYQVKDLLGHSSVAVTQRVYAHLLQGTLRTASEVVGRTVETAMVREAA